MQFIDWKFKGNRIRHTYRNIIQDIFTWLFLTPVVAYLVFFAIYIINYYRKFQTGISFQLVVKHLLIALVVSAVFCLFLLIVLYKFWAYMYHIQKICRMMFSSKYYMVNDMEDPNMMASSDKKMVRDLQYFPKWYFWKRKEVIEITVQLDGSKFNQEYRELSDRFEQMFDLSLVETTERNGFYTYGLLSNASKQRLKIEDIIPIDYKVPLSTGMFWDIAKVPHALITGGTGGGKSRFMVALIKGFILMGADLRIGDPKSSALSDLTRIMPYVASTNEGIIDLVKQAVQQMNKRQLEMKSKENYISGNDFTHYNMQPIIIIIDEYVAFMDSLPSKKVKDEFASYVMQITLKGREAGVFIILATQRPDTSSLAGAVRDNLGMRVSLGEMKADGYRMVFGSTEQKLRNKPGLGRGYIYQNGDSLIREFFAPLVPDSYNMLTEFAKLLDVVPREFSAPAENSSDSATIEASFTESEVINREWR